MIMNVYSVKYEDYNLRLQKTKGIYSTFETALLKCKQFIKEYINDCNKEIYNDPSYTIDDDCYDEINIRDYSYDDSNIKFPSFIIYKTTIDDDKNDEFIIYGLKEKIKIDFNNIF